ncbi:hypothetical protein HYW99_02830 [Candidatus Woesearchaeota archaeon]|nr:hypothetical protein [Candidatus Woesearchaeota archaeon]
MDQEKTLEQRLAEGFISLAKPDTAFKLVKPDLDRVTREFSNAYVPEPVPEDKLEGTFNAVAKTYVNSLYRSVGKPEPIVDGPEWYGGLVRDWASKVGEGHLQTIKDAIKKGDAGQLISLLNQAYQAQAGTAKVQTNISNIQNQPSNVQLASYGIIAKEVNGSVAKVATNLPGTYAALQQLYATQERLK